MNTVIDTIAYPFVFTTSKSFYSLPKPRKECAVKKHLACTESEYCLIFLFVFFENIGERSSEARERKLLPPLPLPPCTGGQ